MPHHDVANIHLLTVGRAARLSDQWLRISRAHDSPQTGSSPAAFLDLWRSPRLICAPMIAG
jgi:hypothetical protein